jgi:hypothetical protein
MDQVFAEFYHRLAGENGNALALTLSPTAPTYNHGLLYSFYRSSNVQQIDYDIRSRLKPNNVNGLSKAESTAWIEVFVSYWKAVGEILAVEDSIDRGNLRDGQFTSVYDAWKVLTNTLVKHHTSNALPMWTIPCLYETMKHLRIFAIKADEQNVSTKGSVTFSAGLQDDIVSSVEKNAKLEDCARLLNRTFAMCLGDRSPLEKSRKWGTYYTANLLFKTYFKVRSRP